MKDRLTIDDIIERKGIPRHFRVKVRVKMWKLSESSRLYRRIMSLPFLRRWEIVDCLGNFRCEYLRKGDGK